MRTLLTNCDIIANETFEILKNAYLLIEDEKIAYIGLDKPMVAVDSEKNLKNHLLISGLYNTHTHSPMTLLRGTGSGLPLDRWLNEAIFPIEDRLTNADISVGSQIAIMEMLACGTVSFTDMYACPEETAIEAINAGIKANLNRPIIGFDPNEPYAESSRVSESIKFYKNYHHAGGDLIRAEFAIHAEYTNNDNLARAYAEDCIQYGAQMHIHLSETEKEHKECIKRHGKTPTEWFNDLGVLDSKTTAAHCVWVSDSDIEILKAKNVTCVHNPTSNMKLGSGFMPINKLLKAGINVAIGTDGTASNNNLNILEEMHLASIIHCGYHNDPTLMTPDAIYRMATISGALSQSRDNCGVLQVGNYADIVAIDMDKPHLLPNLDTLSLLCYSVQASDIAMTIINGKIVYENGIYHTIDSEKVKHNLKATIKRLYNV